MEQHLENFNETLVEFFDEISTLLDILNDKGLSKKDGTFADGLKVLVKQSQGPTVINCFCESYEIWKDCYKRDPRFLETDLSSLLPVKIELNEVQVIVKVFLEQKSDVITQEDIDYIFDYLFALCRHASRYSKAIGNPFELPLDVIAKRFGA